LIRYEVVQQNYARAGLREVVLAVVQEEEPDAALRAAFTECAVFIGLFHRSHTGDVPPTPFYVREVPCVPKDYPTCDHFKE
jgi:hypothetical protein